ncbi:alginate lyase family protein [Microbulbifer sp. OS29]|uniref:Alginate lyase family protein n=1 Tax=Microbulbifer okhotskensis TaxID=2926617 RepID=A0A9X2J705_9GAMM|nr:alginate lyase family protein [Microbulbifer okhotskensis]MCO1336029.1 alginate lyase family protein [Microbulbifer okhotskensis]
MKYARWLAGLIIPKRRHFPSFYSPSERPAYLANTPRNTPRNTVVKIQTFILYRIIGNDLTPRHSTGQSKKNLEFILKHEPPLEGCQKIFILNRIVDPTEEKEIIHLLHSHQKTYLRIPFKPDDYRKVQWNILDFPIDYVPYKLKGLRLRRDLAMQAELSLYRHKNNYVMNNNGARNFALQDGKSKADWILPWDGNCFITKKAWREIKHQVLENTDYPYHVIPMARLLDNQFALREDFKPEPTEEPQIIFHSKAKEVFDCNFCYGRRPKVELLWRLGVPGKWDNWAIFPWDLPCPSYSSDAGNFTQGGWVARLYSGKSHLERKDQQSSRDRGETRSEAIIAMLDQLDERSYSFSESKASFLPPREKIESITDDPHSRLLQEAYQRITEPRKSRQPLSIDQALQDLLICSLAQLHSDRPQFVQYINSSLENIFPNKSAEQHNSLLKAADPSNLSFFLHALRHLKQSKYLNQNGTASLDHHLQGYLTWLMNSQSGQSMRSQPGYIGTLYDFLVASIGLYLDKKKIVIKTLRDSRFRILEQFDSLGKQPHVLKSRCRAHYCCLNLQGWLNLAELAQNFEEDLWNFSPPKSAGIKLAIHSLFNEINENREYKQHGAFDPERLLPIANTYQQKYGDLPSIPGNFTSRSIPQCKPIFPIENGIIPYWNLGTSLDTKTIETSGMLITEGKE